MCWHTVNYKAQNGSNSGRLVHLGWWLSELPRLMLWCRLRGHRPVVDGYGPYKPGLHAARWVACDRCGVRPDPQGSLNPDEYDVGQPYEGPRDFGEVIATLWSGLIPELRPGTEARPYGPPGTWPDSPKGGIGGEIVIGGGWWGSSVGVELGHAGSEHVLDAHLRLGPLFAIYFHTEWFGTWLQRRFNRIGYDAREFRLSLEDWSLRWLIWARRDQWSRDDPWWMSGSVSFDLVEKVFGPKRYSYEQVGDEETGVVVMPEGDQHEVRLTLRRERLGRPRLRWRDRLSWSVQWTADPGSPYGSSRDMNSWCVQVDDEAVRAGTWQGAALLAIRVRMSEMRARYGYRPTPEIES